MIKKSFIALITIITLIIAYFLFVSDYVKIDLCLDAGGRWSSDAKECVTK
jgi:hypothetical protein